MKNISKTKKVIIVIVVLILIGVIGSFGSKKTDNIDNEKLKQSETTSLLRKQMKIIINRNLRMMK